MGIQNYTDLKASVADWLYKSNLTSQIPDFITIAEKNLGRQLDVSAMFTRATINFSADDAYEDLPANTVGIIQAYIDNASDDPLVYRTPSRIHEEFPLATRQKPVAYTVLGKEDSDTLEMAVGYMPDSAYAINVYLRKKIPLLSDSNTTNYWTSNTPDLLLYGSLMAAEPFLKRDERIATWRALYVDAINEERTFSRKFRNTEQQDGVPPGMVA